MTAISVDQAFNNNTSSRQNALTVVKIIVLAVGYFAAGKLGLYLEPVSGVATLVWPATGISVSALVLFGNRLWPGITLGAFVVNLSIGVPVLSALGIGVGNTLQAVTALSLIRRFLPGFDGSFHRLRDVLGFLLFAAMVSATVSATVGVTSSFLGGVVQPSEYLKTWFAWWFGDAMGVAIVAPLVLTWSQSASSKSSWNAEFFVLLVSVAITSLVVFSGWFGNTVSLFHSYTVFPFLIWVALRFGQREVTAVIFLITIIAVAGTASSHGPFSQPTLVESLFNLQVFMAVVVVVGLLLGASVSERREAQEELQEAIRTAPNAIVLVDNDGRIVFVNSRLEQLFGYSERELIGQSIEMLIPERFRRQHQDDRSAYSLNPVARPMGWGRDLFALHKDGQEFSVEIGLSPLQFGAKSVVLASIIDTSQRKRVEQLLKRNEERYRVIFELTNDYAYEDRVEPDGRIVPEWFTTGVTRITGYTLEDTLAPDFWLKLVYPEDHPILFQHSERILAGQADTAEVRIVTKDGDIRWLRNSAYPVLNAEGRVVRFYGAAQDITENKREEETIRLLAQALESAEELISITDLNNRFIYVNRAFLEHYGYTRDEVIGKTPEILRSQKYYSPAVNDIAKLTQEKGWWGELINVRKDGTEFSVFLSTSSIKDTQGRTIGLIGVARDISDQKEAERALLQAEIRFRSMFSNPIGTVQAEEVQHERRFSSSSMVSTVADRIDDITKRMRESVRQTLSFSSLASHELRTPLSVIQQHLEAALHVRQSEAKRRKLVVGVYDEVLRLNRTVNDLLSLSTMYAGTFKLQEQHIDFRKVLRDFCDEASALARRKKVAVTLGAGPKVFVNGDVDRLRQVLFNLFDNSLKHVPEGGRIDLSYEIRGGEVVFNFSDNGSGIPSDRLPYIFNPFYRVTPTETHGAGLGLALVKLIVEAHKGSITVASSRKVGTTFSLKFPLSSELA